MDSWLEPQFIEAYVQSSVCAILVIEKYALKLKEVGLAWEFEVVAGPYTFTEGPVWTGESILFTDMYNHRVLQYCPATGETEVFRGDTNQGNGLLWSPRGSLYCCEMIGRRVSRYAGDALVDVIANQFEGRCLNSPNDLVMDSLGRIWFTDPRYGEDRGDMELEHESVYRLTPTLSGAWEIERMTFDTTRPNGLLLSLDEQTLYVAQSDYGEGRKRELRAYPVLTDGSLGNFRVMHNFAPARGIDGMTIDRADRIVATAGWSRNGAGPMIYVFESSGRVLQTHPVPVDMPTNCCFGGEGLTELYVTAGSGHLFRAKTDLEGVPR